MGCQSNLKYYLSKRKQNVQMNDSNSDILYCTTGIPHGFIRGPLLFIICMYDLAQASKMFDFIINANDTTLSELLLVYL